MQSLMLTGTPHHDAFRALQAKEVEGGAAARSYKGGISDKDIVDFLVNVECLEGQFDTWGVFGARPLGSVPPPCAASVRGPHIRISLSS
jgi:hypothetical protein